MLRRWLPKGSLRYAVAANTVSQLVGRVLSTIVMTIVSFLLARQFGANGYGDFVKITTYVGFFYLFADFGLNAAYVQGSIEANAPATDTKGWRQLFGLRLVWSVFLVGVAFFVLSLFPEGSGQGYTPLVRLGILFMTPVIVAQAATTTTNAYFQKILRYDLATIAQNAGSVVTLVTALYFLLFTHVNGAYLGVIAVFAGSFVTVVFALYYVRKFHGAVLPLFSLKHMVRDFGKTLPLGLTLIFNLIYFHSDSVVLTLTRSTHEVGVYGLAYKVFELPLVFPLFFINAIYPILVKAGRSKSSSPQNIFWQSMWFLLGSSLVALIGLWIAAPLVALVRPDFVDSVEPLRILLLGLPIFFVTALLMWVLIAQKQPWKLLVIHTIAMCINVGLNIVFIPMYGYIAAAWITGASELFILITSFALVLPRFFRNSTI